MSRQLAIVRIILGIAQIMAATMTAMFLMQSGVNSLSLWSGAVTVALVIASNLLFKRSPLN